MIEQACCDNALQVAFLRKDVEDWKRRASLAEAEAQMLRDSLQDRIATHHTNGMQSLERELAEERVRRQNAERNLERVRSMRVVLGHKETNE